MRDGLSFYRYNGSTWQDLGWTDNVGLYGSIGMISHGSLVVTGEGQVAIIGGARQLNGDVDEELIFTYDLVSRVINTPYGLGSNLIRGTRNPAAAYLNGSIYVFGGSVDGEVGATGTADAFKLDGRCFDGVLNGLENSNDSYEEFDSGGGCGIKGYGHRSGLGGGHISTSSPSGSNNNNAFLNCKAEAGRCASAGCSYYPVGKTCADTDFPVWVSCITAFNLSSLHVTPGTVYNGCTDEVLGQFD